MLKDMFLEAARSRLTGREEAIRQTVRAYLDSYRSGDIEGRLSLFAPDATFEDPIGSDPIHGHEGLRAFWTAGAGLKVQMNLEMLAVNGSEAAFVFNASIAAGDDAAKIRGIETLLVDEAGLIVRLRAHFDDTLIG